MRLSNHIHHKESVQQVKKKSRTVKYPTRHLDVYLATEDRLNSIDLNNIGFARPEYREVFQEILKEEKWVALSKELDFTVADHRKMHAIITLADQFGFPERGIVVSPADYYRAYGLTRKQTKKGKQYKGRAVETAKRNLFSGKGVNPTPIVYVPRDHKTKKRQCAVVAHRPLYRVIEIYPDMPSQDVERLPEDLRVYRRTRKVLWHIKLHPLLVEDHEAYYKYADREFYTCLKAAVRQLRGPEAHVMKYLINCYLWLLRQDKQAITLKSDTKFANDVLKIGKKTVTKNPKYVSRKIGEILRVLKEAGYLMDFDRVRLRTGEERWKIWVDRERFPSLRKPKQKEVMYALH